MPDDDALVKDGFVEGEDSVAAGPAVIVALEHALDGLGERVSRDEGANASSFSVGPVVAVLSVEPEPCFAISSIRAVTPEAPVGQDGPDIAIEADAVFDCCRLSEESEDAGEGGRGQEDHLWERVGGPHTLATHFVVKAVVAAPGLSAQAVGPPWACSEMRRNSAFASKMAFRRLSFSS